MPRVTRLLAALIVVCASSAAAAEREPPARAAPDPAPVSTGAPARGSGGAAPAEPPPELTSAAFKRFANGRAKEVRRCYDAALQKDPALHGKLMLRFNVLPSGAIADVRVTSTSFKARAVPRCVVDVFRSWRTPFRPAEPVGIEYPLSFAPQR